MLVVVSVGRAAHHAVVEDMDADVRDRVIDDDARGNDLDAEEPLERDEAEVHQCIVDGFHKEFEASVDALVVVVVKEHMGIQIGDRTRCGKQMNGTVNKVDPGECYEETEDGQPRTAR